MTHLQLFLCCGVTSILVGMQLVPGDAFCRAQEYAVHTLSASETDRDGELQYTVYIFRPHGPDAVEGSSYSVRPDGIVAKGISMKMLIAHAFDIGGDHIVGGPKWLTDPIWDFQAKVDESDIIPFQRATRQKRASMLRAILQKEVSIKAHTEKRQRPIYELRVLHRKAWSGESQEETLATPGSGEIAGLDQGGMTMFSAKRWTCKNVPMSVVVAQLQTVVRRPVADMTGLKSRYSFDITWGADRDDSELGGNVDVEETALMLRALERQLGLKLVSTRKSVPVMLIDHIRKPCSVSLR